VKIIVKLRCFQGDDDQEDPVEVEKKKDF